MAFHLQPFQTRIFKPFFKTIFVTRVYFEPHANVEKLCREIISHLKINNKVNVVESNEEECDVKVVFCPIVSRAGTDIDAALYRLTREKPTIMIVLHHTFDPEHIAPSSSSWDIENVMMMVDVLFHEDSGLLKCSNNNKAIERAEHYLQKISQPQRVVNMLAVISAGVIVSASVFALKKRDKLQKKIIYLYLYFKWMRHFNMFSWRESTDSDEF
ncbi:uncharacterized protein LOC124376524 [Silurus meridionalis]|uniref:uncharacterized protein LOC124376524 n=1 Tax=Silurus meridionalis TaxID=175797 RepID=UPI001EECA29E|nr:uncharacterized protein LOC124376524 [Silurus meridionalis]XP_046691606.1 uncharacterized protein LOC124376524 [Silurus meridionalis]